MLKVRSYILIALVVYVMVLLSALPASLIVNQVEKQMPGGFKAHSTSGTVWNGSVQGEALQQAFRLNWDLNLWRLLLLQLSADVHVESQLLDAKSRLALAYKRFDIDGLNGVINAQSLSKLLSENGIDAEIANDVTLQNIILSRANAKFDQASGKAIWDGGIVKVQNLPSGSAELPPLDAVLSLHDEGFALVMSTIASDAELAKSLMDIDMSHDGRAHLRLKERVADFVPVPSQLKQGDPEGIMFEIKREIFNTGGAF